MQERDEMVRRMEEQKAITQEITSDLTRQYKDMQANLELQIGDLEARRQEQDVPGEEELGYTDDLGNLEDLVA